MARKEMSVERYQEIKRLLELKIPINQIIRTMKCTKRTVRQIRDGLTPEPGRPKPIEGPLWAEQINWDEVKGELSAGHPLKLIWEEKAEDKVTYVNFWKQFNRRFPFYKQDAVVHRVFEPGDRCEVDYGGEGIEWIDLKTGEIHEAPVFLGALGFCQRLFAHAREDTKSRNFLECHNKMYAEFGGVPKITVPDCLKQGVTKCHLYDPDINTAYADLARHYNTAIVPARASHPKDKSIVEGLVKILMRYFKWRYRRQTFTSIEQINQALKEVVDRINRRPHTRFRVSRYELWEKTEKDKLGLLPTTAYEHVEWKVVKLHPDAHVCVEGTYYSAPHMYRGQKLKVKLSQNHIEIFHGLERIAIHKRSRQARGKYITALDHLPQNAKAYLETTPQKLLSSAKYLSPALHALLDELFTENALAHLRRSQGLIREARKEIVALGPERGKSVIKKALDVMKSYNRIRVPYFRALLNQSRIEMHTQNKNDGIKRKPNNPMLRYTQPSQSDQGYPAHGQT